MTVKEAFVNWRKAVNEQAEEIKKKLSGIDGCVVDSQNAHVNLVGRDGDGEVFELQIPIVVRRSFRLSQSDLSLLDRNDF